LFDPVSIFGPYKLNEPVGSLEGLTEFSPLEYAVLASNLSNNMVFHAPPVDFLGHQWQVTIGSLGGRVYRIASQFITEQPQIAERVFHSAYAECVRKLGEPSERHGQRVIWNTIKGNVLLNHGSRFGQCYVNLILTSSDAIRQGDAKLRRRKHVMFWNPLLYSDDENLRWCWLRAVEWGRWPIFISQPLAPVLLLFLSWQLVCAAVVAANIIWAIFVRYRFVSVHTAFWGAWAARLKWFTIPGAAIYLFSQGNNIAAVIALSWPIIIFILGAFPSTRIGRIQTMFLSKLGMRADPDCAPHV